MTGPRPWRHLQAAYPRSNFMHPSSSNLSDWSREHLIAYIRKLEASQHKLAKSRNPTYPQPPHPSPSHLARTQNQKPFDFSKHPCRKIALKFSYDGSHYSGLAAQNDVTPLPTVEEVLWGALTFTRLVDPKEGFERTGWEKCGRTDAGVSSAGQVVSFWIRSALRSEEQQGHDAGPSSEASSKLGAETEVEAEIRAEAIHASISGAEAGDLGGLEGDFGALSEWNEPPSNTNIRPASTPQSGISDEQELKYIGSLNNVLPPSIRVIAWSPVAPDFSARFACKYRHYKYFFTSHGLDIDSMRDAAARLVGEHDFRNLCKIDAGKQITNFRRTILRAEISSVSGLPADEGESLHGPGQVYVLDLVGTAFLYNQVRHIMAILLLIGTRLEKPWLMTALLNVDPESPYPPFRPGEPVSPVVPTKPVYQMADALPLVLWDCAYADEDVSWRIDGERFGKDAGKTVGSNLFAQQRAAYERSLIRAALDKHFLLAANKHHNPPPEYLPLSPEASLPSGAVFGVPLGGGKERRGARYVPVLERERLDPVEVMNERWRVGKGARRAEQTPNVAEEDNTE